MVFPLPVPVKTIMVCSRLFMKRRHEGFSNRSVLEFRQEEAVRFIAVKRRLQWQKGRT